MRKKCQSDLNFRLRKNLRKRIWAVIKLNQKSDVTIKLIGCSLEFLKQYLEKQFKQDMTWNNYGKKGWEVDHIIPCASFDLSKSSEQKKCFNYKNLQPLWIKENRSKGFKILKGEKYGN